MSWKSKRSRGRMSDYKHMTLEQLQQEHAELLEFNETLIRNTSIMQHELKSTDASVNL